MPIFVINLRRRTDRRDSVRSQLGRHDLACVLMDAVDGWFLDLDAYPPRPDWMTPGVLGCTLSHIRVWEEIAERSHEYAIILEDDIALPDDFPDRLDRVLFEATFPYDLIYLSSYHDPGVPMVSAHIGAAPWAFGLHAYLVSATGVRKLLDFVRPSWWPVDNQIAEELRLNKYLVTPNMGHTMGFSSDIAPR